MNTLFDPTSEPTFRPVTGVGFAVRREDDTFAMANHSLCTMTACWSAVEQWWIRVRRRITLPAATQCPVCGMAQILGILEATIPDPSNPETERIFEISFTGHAHDLGVAGDLLMVRELTLFKRKVKALEESIHQYESVCESIHDVYYRTDMRGNILFISPSCQKILSYTSAELVGRSLIDLCVDPEYWNELLDIFAKTEVVNDFDLVLQCKKGNQVPVSLNARLIYNDKGEQVAVDGIFRDITEREHLNGILAERTRKLQNTMAEMEHQKFALDQHAIVCTTDSEGKIIYANRKMAEISQYAVSDLKGQNPRIVNSGYHPKSFFKEMWRTITSCRVWHGEIRNRKKDGSFYWIDCTIVPFMTPAGKPYQYVSISTDITERISAEHRMERSRSFLLSITDAMGEGIYVLDLQGRLVFLNREAERLLGWREEELLGKNLHDSIHFKKLDGTHLPAEECPVHRSLLGRTFRVDEDHFTRKDGSMIPVSYVTSPFLENGEIAGSVAVFQEISQRLKSDHEMRQSREMALEASRLKSEFLANMSHEIRTPMNAIIGMNELLMDTPLNEEQHDFAETVRDSAQSLLTLINDILDFSKIEVGKIDLETIDFSPVMVVEGSAELLASQAHEKGLSLNTFISPRIPRMLRGDPGRLRQMLINLISNAIKFTEEGEVVVRAHLESETPSRVTLFFSINDTGIGLSKSAHQRLFKPFSQADGATTRKYGGTGLGLAISKRLVELMGGQIGAEGKEGEGSTFWFRVPFLRAEHAPNLMDELHLEPLRGRRILALTAYDSDRQMLDGYLQAWGLSCKVRVGMDSRDYMIQDTVAQQEWPDIFLVAMTQSDHETGLYPKLFRDQGLPENVPVVALLDSHDREWEEEALAAGFARCLVKPLRQSELVDGLVELVDPELARSRVEPAPMAVSKESAPPDPDVYDALESGKLILLAEDNLVNQKVALMQLKKLGYAAHAVVNGKEAVEAASHLPYALILMDCQMPVMDGFEATHAIRKMETASSRHIPIIAMTANAMKGDRERCLKAGMDDYLSKPVAPEDLKKRLEYWIPKSAGELPPVEINQLFQLFGNDEELVRELLHHFLPSARELLDKVRQTLEARASEELMELAHELRGACGNVGASAMAQAARRLERATAAQDWEEADNTMRALESAFVRVENFIRKF